MLPCQIAVYVKQHRNISDRAEEVAISPQLTVTIPLSYS